MYDLRSEVKKQLNLDESQLTVLFNNYPRFKIAAALSTVRGDIEMKRKLFKFKLSQL
jgi:hypothetical protein